MTIYITGAQGKVGNALTQHWKDRDVRYEVLGIPPNCETLVHLALAKLNMEFGNDCVYAINLLIETLRQCRANGVRRIIFASSTLAEPERYGVPIPMTWYGAAKAASEAILRGYAEQERIPVVSLRLGLFKPTVEPADWEKRLAVSEQALMGWFDAALAFNQPRAVIWNALGGEFNVN